MFMYSPSYSVYSTPFLTGYLNSMSAPSRGSYKSGYSNLSTYPTASSLGLSANQPALFKGPSYSDGATNEGPTTGGPASSSSKGFGDFGFGDVNAEAAVDTGLAGLGAMGAQAGIAGGLGAVAGMSPSQALGFGMATGFGPTAAMGAVGAVANTALGFDQSVTGPVAGSVIGGMLGGPVGGLIGGLLGGPLGTLAADTFDARKDENIKDTLEEAVPGVVSGYRSSSAWDKLGMRDPRVNALAKDPTVKDKIASVVNQYADEEKAVDARRAMENVLGDLKDPDSYAITQALPTYMEMWAELDESLKKDLTIADDITVANMYDLPDIPDLDVSFGPDPKTQPSLAPDLSLESFNKALADLDQQISADLNSQVSEEAAEAVSDVASSVADTAGQVGQAAEAADSDTSTSSSSSSDSSDSTGDGGSSGNGSGDSGDGGGTSSGDGTGGDSSAGGTGDGSDSGDGDGGDNGGGDGGY